MKNTMKAMTLAIVLSFGATFANAGILVTDRADSAAGILVTDRSDSAAGILVTDLTNTGCNSTERRGIIVTDIFGTMASLAGILVSDLTGILVTDLTGRNEGCGSSPISRSITKNGQTNSVAGILVTD